MVTLGEVMIDVWRKALVDGASEVEVAGKPCQVTRTRNAGFRMVSFPYGDILITGIEQNPEKTSRWAKLAQQGERIMQFSHHGQYVGNVCEGRLTRYSAWKSQNLPD